MKTLLSARFFDNGLHYLPTGMVAFSALLVIALTGFIAFNTARTSYPVDMWEASATVVAARLSAGESLYARINESNSIEPGLYAPLQLYLMSSIFRLSGPNLWVFRAINIAAGAAFIIIMLRVLDLHRNLWCALVGSSVLLAVDRQITGLWALPRLDAVLVLCGLVFLTGKCCDFFLCCFVLLKCVFITSVGGCGFI